MPLLLWLLAQAAAAPQITAPRGFVNDFAGVIAPAAAARMEATLREVLRLTHGDIVVVTMADLGRREAGDVALQIGRQWKLGGAGPAGDPSKDLGVVLLLEPLENHQPGTGQVFIATGRGAEKFLTDASVGRIRDAMRPSFRSEDYSAGLEIGVGLLAQAFADQFHVTLATPTIAPDTLAAGPGGGGGGGPAFPRPLVAVVIFLTIVIFLSALSRAGRGSLGGLWWLSLLAGWGGGRPGRWGGGGRGGGSWGGFGGGGGGGFGGFGGGGGFSGGGAGGRF